MIPLTGPNSEILFLVRTDFSDDDAWHRVDEVAGREGTGVVTVNDPANRHLDAATLASELPTFSQGVLLADHVTMSTSEQLVLVCPTRYDEDEDEVAPFRAPAALLTYVVSPIVLGSKNWSEVSGLVNQDGVFSLDRPRP